MKQKISCPQGLSYTGLNAPSLRPAQGTSGAAAVAKAQWFASYTLANSEDPLVLLCAQHYIASDGRLSPITEALQTPVRTQARAVWTVHETGQRVDLLDSISTDDFEARWEALRDPGGCPEGNQLRFRELAGYLDPRGKLLLLLELDGVKQKDIPGLFGSSQGAVSRAQQKVRSVLRYLDRAVGKDWEVGVLPLAGGTRTGSIVEAWLRTLSVSAAAKLLGVAQSSVTKALADTRKRLVDLGRHEDADLLRPQSTGVITAAAGTGNTAPWGTAQVQLLKSLEAKHFGAPAVHKPEVILSNSL